MSDSCRSDSDSFAQQHLERTSQHVFDPSPIQACDKIAQDIEFREH